jgi:translocation and assembly module TamA
MRVFSFLLLRWSCLLVATALLLPGPAQALDILGWLGLGPAAEAPAVSVPGSAPYALSFDIRDAPAGDIEPLLRDASTLYRLRNQPAPDPEGLVRLTEADLARLMNALWGEGYYNARVVADLAGVTLIIGNEPSAAAVNAARARVGRELVPIRLIVEPGPQFTLRRVAVFEADPPRPFAPEVVSEATVRLPPGSPARSAAVLAAQSRVIDRLRSLSHPFAKAVSLDPVVFHPERVMDVALGFAPGPTATLGMIDVSGLETIDPAVVRSFIYAKPGEPYSPETIASIRRSVSRIEALGSVRVREGTALDGAGGLPIFVELTERKPRALGISAGFSSVDGPQAQAYWTHRNLFGGAEVLRVEGNLTYLTAFEGQDRGFSAGDIGGSLRVSFLKPALGGTRNDLLAEASYVKAETAAYQAQYVNAAIGIRHRWSDTFSAQASLEAEHGRARDILGSLNYTLIGLPVSVLYDSTDNPLDPTRGVKLAASLAPYLDRVDDDQFMGVGRLSGSAYWSLDETGRMILAGRLGFGSIVGPDLLDIPANRRLYAGGAGSVRGYELESLSPLVFGHPIGGRSLLDGSIEARFKITETIGIVPFVDAGMAFDDSLPDFGAQHLAVGVGLGLRYFTAIGPIRLDVATPLNRDYGDRPVVLYVSIGQAF